MVKQLVISYDKQVRADVERIAALAVEAGYLMDLPTAALLWELHSDYYYCAGWMGLPESDDELLKDINMAVTFFTTIDPRFDIKEHYSPDGD